MRDDLWCRVAATTYVRRRQPTDMDDLVSLLRAVHESDGFPARWPNDPHAWLTPSTLVAAWTGRQADAPAPVGHVGLTQVVPGRDTTELWCHSTCSPPAQLRCVTALFVAPPARGTGLGAALLATAASFARTEGRRAVLEVASSDQAAVALYEAQGWVRVGVLADRTYLPADAVSLLYVSPLD